MGTRSKILGGGALIKRTTFASVVIDAAGGFGNFIVTNSPNEAKVQNWAKSYVGNGLELIRSEIY